MEFKPNLITSELGGSRCIIWSTRCTSLIGLQICSSSLNETSTELATVSEVKEIGVPVGGASLLTEGHERNILLQVIRTPAFHGLIARGHPCCLTKLLQLSAGSRSIHAKAAVTTQNRRILMAKYGADVGLSGPRGPDQVHCDGSILNTNEHTVRAHEHWVGYGHLTIR